MKTRNTNNIWITNSNQIFDLFKNVYSAICQSFPIISQEAIKDISV